MKKRNKKYKPRTVVMNPINYFMGGLKRIDQEHQTDLNLKNRLAMIKILNGEGDRDAFNLLCGMVNMALVLTEVHFNEQYIKELYAGRNALHAIGQRFLNINKLVVKGEEKKDIELAFEIHEAQLSTLRVIDVERAYVEVQRRIDKNLNTLRITQPVQEYEVA